MGFCPVGETGDIKPSSGLIGLIGLIGLLAAQQGEYGNTVRSMFQHDLGAFIGC